MQTQPELTRTARLERLVPAAAWLRGSRRATLGQDLFAALIVTLMLIPQSLAYAMLAGLPPRSGCTRASAL